MTYYEVYKERILNSLSETGGWEKVGTPGDERWSSFLGDPECFNRMLSERLVAFVNTREGGLAITHGEINPLELFRLSPLVGVLLVEDVYALRPDLTGFLMEVDQKRWDTFRCFLAEGGTALEVEIPPDFRLRPVTFGDLRSEVHGNHPFKHRRVWSLLLRLRYDAPSEYPRALSYCEGLGFSYAVRSKNVLRGSVPHPLVRAARASLPWFTGPDFFVEDTEDLEALRKGVKAGTHKPRTILKEHSLDLEELLQLLPEPCEVRDCLTKDPPVLDLAWRKYHTHKAHKGSEQMFPWYP